MEEPYTILRPLFSFIYFFLIFLILLIYNFRKKLFICTRSIINILNLEFKDIKCIILHNFHILRLSSYAYYMFFATMGLTSSFVIFFKYGLVLPFVYRLIVVLFIAFVWGKDISIEGLRGYHNFFVIDGFKFGVILFIFREFMFFFSNF